VDAHEAFQIDYERRMFAPRLICPYEYYPII